VVASAGKSVIFGEKIPSRTSQIENSDQATAQQRPTIEKRQALAIKIVEAAWLSDPLAAILQRADQVVFARWLLNHQPIID
jgi:hypothetical protein